LVDREWDGGEVYPVLVRLHLRRSLEPDRGNGRGKERLERVKPSEKQIGIVNWASVFPSHERGRRGCFHYDKDPCHWVVLHFGLDPVDQHMMEQTRGVGAEQDVRSKYQVHTSW
jgi:hypothetical protein